MVKNSFLSSGSRATPQYIRQLRDDFLKRNDTNNGSAINVVADAATFSPALPPSNNNR